jgi:alginate O-acetyltransferase complex protein AlgI
MQFGAAAFWAVFGAFYLAYLAVHRHVRARNILLLLASYAFYASWDWRFLPVLLGSTVFAWWWGRVLARAGSRKRALLWTGIVAQLGVLAVFKYTPVLASPLGWLAGLAGWSIDGFTAHVLLPLGISFYTFQILSYWIDIVGGKQEPAADPVAFALFLTFFPKIIAGPIERASHLLPQFAERRPLTVQRLSDGFFLITWGLVQKLCIADNAVKVSDRLFDHPADPSVSLLSGSLALTLQIYADFSGYSDIAKGIASLLGFELSWNFRLPYFARNPSDFWRRWHISLSDWCRDYVYISLGGSRAGDARTYVNLMATMLAVGVWHGARWMFLLWGAYQGLLLAGHRFAVKAKLVPAALMEDLHSYGLPGAVLFCFTMFGWLLFRSASWAQFSDVLTHARFLTADDRVLPFVVALWAPVLLMNAYQSLRGDLLAVARWSVWKQMPFYYLAVYALLYLPPLVPQSFVYMQF